MSFLTMSTKTKAAALLAALTLGTSIVAGSGEAQAHHWGWGGVGLGVAAGAMIGAGIASRAYEPSYIYVDAPRCRWIRQFNANGTYVGKTKVCNY
jgi:hypothetical protein